MAKVRQKAVDKSDQTLAPMISPEAREARMCALAIDLAEKQLREGTASSQVITHYLKVATSKYKYENEHLLQENEMLKAKTEALRSQQRTDEQLQKVLDALRSYSGGGDDQDL